MKSALSISATLAVHFASAQYLVSPPAGGVAAPGASPDCSAWVQQSYSLTCEDIEVYFGITQAEFEEWNPTTTELGTNCTLIPNLYYCVAINYTPLTTPPPFSPSSTSTSVSSSSGTSTSLHTTTTSSTKTSTTSSTLPPPTTPVCTAGVAIASPTPYGVVCGVSADAVALTGTGLLTAYTSSSPFVLSAQACGAQCIATATCTNIYFVAGSSCNLHYGKISYTINNSGVNAYSLYNVSCFSDSVLKSSTPSGAVCDVQADSVALSGAGLLVGYTGASGSPYVTSIQACATQCFSTSTCTNMYFVNGTTCNLHYGPTSYVVNASGVGAFSLYDLTCFSSCPFPTPYQTGMAMNCNKFHLVVSGDQCGTVATSAGITLANFYLWNPTVGSTCATLDLGDYVCIGVS